jgi:hypothetical protein
MKKILLLNCLLLVNQLSFTSQQEPNDLSSMLSPIIAQCKIGNITVINQLSSDICDGDDN